MNNQLHTLNLIKIGGAFFALLFFWISLLAGGPLLIAVAACLIHLAN